MSNVTGVTNTSQAYAAYGSTTGAKVAGEKAAESKAPESGVVYDKSSESAAKSKPVAKMSADERASLVSQLKADMANQQSRLAGIVSQMLGNQATTFGQATDMWKILASGKFEVDAATKAQAQKDISEDGYWGVKQTSQRLFDFASALAGDDPEKMKKMQAAVQKGFDQATKAWGKELPSISKETLDAANKLFEDYYNSRE